MDGMKLSEQLKTLVSSPARDEDRLQVLICLTAQLAEEVERIKERNWSHDRLNTPMDAVLRNQERTRQSSFKDIDFSKIDLEEPPP